MKKDYKDAFATLQSTDASGVDYEEETQGGHIAQVLSLIDIYALTPLLTAPNIETTNLRDRTE